MDINVHTRALDLLFQLRSKAHENFKGSAKINGAEGGAPEHFDHSSNVKEITNGFIHLLQRTALPSTPLGVFRENIRNSTMSDYVLFGSEDPEHLQSAKLLRIEVSNSQNGKAMTEAIRKIDIEIAKRIVDDESSTGSVVEVLKSIFLTCAISPEGLIDAAQTKLKCNFLTDNDDDRNLVKDNLINLIKSKFNYYFDFSRYCATTKFSRFRDIFSDFMSQPAKALLSEEENIFARILADNYSSINENYLRYEHEEYMAQTASANFKSFMEEKLPPANNWRPHSDRHRSGEDKKQKRADVTCARCNHNKDEKAMKTHETVNCKKYLADNTRNPEYSTDRKSVV